ncbi:MAG: hypothetical protein RhofKO_05300 [Rhodothermales bacterium]
MRAVNETSDRKPLKGSRLKARFDFQAEMLAAYLSEALPDHTSRQARILLQNLVRTGHRTMEQAT